MSLVQVAEQKDLKTDLEPFDIGEKNQDPLSLYLMDINMAPASLSGLPSLSIPAGFSSNRLPIGFQLIGPRWCDNSLFEVGKKYQSKTGWHLEKP